MHCDSMLRYLSLSYCYKIIWLIYYRKGDLLEPGFKVELMLAITGGQAWAIRALAPITLFRLKRALFERLNGQIVFIHFYLQKPLLALAFRSVLNEECLPEINQSNGTDIHPSPIRSLRNLIRQC